MKKLAFCCLFAGWTIQAVSQDLIVTDEGDSLNVKITRMDDKNIYFNYKNTYGSVVSTMVAEETTKSLKVGYYQSSKSPGTSQGELPKFRLALSAGPAFRTAKTLESGNPVMDTHLNELKSGYNFHIDIAGFPGSEFGFGLEYSLFRSKNSVPNIRITTENGVYTGRMDDDISINYVAPALYVRGLTGKSHYLIGMSMGYMGYKDRAFLGDDFIIKSSTFGASLTIDWDLLVSKNSALGIKLTMSGGTLDKFTVENGVSSTEVELGEDEREGLSRIDIALGYRFFSR